MKSLRRLKRAYKFFLTIYILIALTLVVVQVFSMSGKPLKINSKIYLNKENQLNFILKQDKEIQKKLLKHEMLEMESLILKDIKFYYLDKLESNQLHSYIINFKNIYIHNKRLKSLIDNVYTNKENIENNKKYIFQTNYTSTIDFKSYLQLEKDIIFLNQNIDSKNRFWKSEKEDYYYRVIFNNINKSIYTKDFKEQRWVKINQILEQISDLKDKNLKIIQVQ